jgi:hypothetical protein
VPPLLTNRLHCWLIAVVRLLLLLLLLLLLPPQVTSSPGPESAPVNMPSIPV